MKAASNFRKTQHSNKSVSMKGKQVLNLCSDTRKDVRRDISSQGLTSLGEIQSKIKVLSLLLARFRIQTKKKSARKEPTDSVGAPTKHKELTRN
jgi:hypothetical protein